METKNFINDKIFSKFELKDKNFIKSQNGNITFHDFFLDFLRTLRQLNFITITLAHLSTIFGSSLDHLGTFARRSSSWEQLGVILAALLLPFGGILKGQWTAAAQKGAQ